MAKWLNGSVPHELADCPNTLTSAYMYSAANLASGGTNIDLGRAAPTWYKMHIQQTQKKHLVLPKCLIRLAKEMVGAEGFEPPTYAL